MRFDVHQFGGFELVAGIVLVVELLEVLLVEGEESIIKMGIVAVSHIAVLIFQERRTEFGGTV